MHRKRTINELRELAWSLRLRSELLSEIVSRAERAGITDCTGRSFLETTGEFLLNELVGGDLNYDAKKHFSSGAKVVRKKPKTYKPEQLAKVLDAVRRCRSAGRDWNETHAEVCRVGFKGTLPLLMRLARETGILPNNKKS